jgi:hypothetical protein
MGPIGAGTYTYFQLDSALILTKAAVILLERKL